MYGVLLIAGGRTHQENYAPLFAADPRSKLIGVVEDRDDRFARSLGLPLLPDLDAALARPDVHIASIAVGLEQRGRIAVQAARAGKHIFMDKPLAASVEDARAIVTACRESGVRSHMDTMVRSHWAARAREVVASGRLGELRSIHCDLLFAKGPAGAAPLGRPRREHFPPRRFTFVDSKRELMTTGVYSLALLAWLTNRPVRTVWATTSNYFFAEHHRNDVEDFGMIALTLDGGLTATLTAGRIGWSSDPAGGPNRILLIGSRATLLIDAYQPRLELYNDAPTSTPPPVYPADPMGFWKSTQAESGVKPKQTWLVDSLASPLSEAAWFLNCIDQKRESDMSAARAAEGIEVLMAAYRSAATGKIIHL
jgi:myo-inositol 2-dehydrogenase / D-chiro-inositol 1-dehydrogenase